LLGLVQLGMEEIRGVLRDEAEMAAGFSLHGQLVVPPGFLQGWDNGQRLIIAHRIARIGPNPAAIAPDRVAVQADFVRLARHGGQRRAMAVRLIEAPAVVGAEDIRTGALAVAAEPDRLVRTV